MAPAWIAAGVAGVVALAAGLTDRARSRRRELDRIGLIDWRSVQMAALLALLVAAGLALKQ
jgi:hypothetical protein